MGLKHNWNDLTGHKFGRWVAREYKGNKTWLCECECGNSGVRATNVLRRGGSRSCGCLQREELGARSRRHGMVDHPAYESWSSAKRRCVDPTRAHYSKKGIKMHPDWLDFNVFWAEMGPSWKSGLSIDRKDNSKGYEPGNCRWSTAKVQSNNRSSCVVIDTPDGSMNITQAAERYGVNRWTIANRLKKGWSGTKLLSPPHKT